MTPDPFDALYRNMIAQLPPPIHAPETCPHEGFASCVGVGRIEDLDGFIAEVRVVCVQCRQAFRFKGAPPGLSFESPTVSIDGLQLHIPIEPEGTPRLFGRATFEMPAAMRRH